MPLMLPRPAHTLITGGGMNGKAASIEEQIAAATASKVRREGSISQALVISSSVSFWQVTAHVEDLAGVQLGALGEVKVISSHAGKDVSGSLAQVYGAVGSLRIRELENAVRSFGDILLVLIGFFQTIDITVLSVKVPWPELFVDAYAWCANFNIPFSIPSPGIYQPLMTYAFKCLAMLMLMWAFLVLWTIRDYDKPIDASKGPEEGQEAPSILT